MALLKGRLQHHTPGLCVLGPSGLPQQGKPFPHFALQNEMRPGCKLERDREYSQHQAGAEGIRGPHLGPIYLSFLHKGWMELEEASGRQMATQPFIRKWPQNSCWMS